MKRIAAMLALAALALAGCSSKHEEIKVIDGREFICSWRETGLGGIRDYTCYPLETTP